LIVGEEVISFLRFADDIAILANSKIDLKKSAGRNSKMFPERSLKNQLEQNQGNDVSKNGSYS